MIALGADNLSSTSATNRDFHMTWKLGESNVLAVGSRLYYATNTTNLSSFSRLGPDLMGTNTSFVHSNLVSGVTYSYYVVAFNQYGLESDPSNVVQCRPENADEDVPKSIQLKPAVSTNTNIWSSFTLVSLPTNGNLTGTAPNLIYLSENIARSTNTLKDSFEYSVQENLATNSEAVTSIVSILVAPKIDTNVYLYIGTQLEWWTSGNFSNRTISNFNVAVFTNPPPDQFYRSYLVITNKPL